MNLKRALFTLIALVMMPVASMAQFTIWPPDPPDITPAETTANIAVANIFLDGNGADETVVTLTCTTGTISPSSALLGNGETQVFVISQIPIGTDNVCTVTETIPGNYDAYYLCDPTNGEDQCWLDGRPPPWDIEDLSTTSCSFGNIQEGDVGACAVYNSPTPVDVDVTKVWEEFGAAQGDFDLDVRLSITCDDALGIVGGTSYGGGTWYATTYLRDGSGDYDDEDGDYIGEGTATFEVTPEWFPMAADPDDQEFTECYVNEDASDQSAVEVDNDCLDIEVAAGMGDECTITNTVFFEGIPTLSQYGMAIMVLLMLGVGFVGMRRIV